MTVQIEYIRNAAVLTIDNPPLNVISQKVRADLEFAIAKVVVTGASRLIITGRGEAFVAGADTREFDLPPLAPHLNEILNRLCGLSIPTIAAINGTALGGGLEIAMACRFRIAAPTVTLGLPEVNLGIVPGAGGTQRLPRLIGIGKALDVIVRGKLIRAEEAKKAGLVDLVDADVLKAALSLDDATLDRASPVDGRPAPSVDEADVIAARQNAARERPNQEAPLRAIELVTASATDALPAALARERATFLDLRASPQARALQHVFFAERAAQSQGRQFPAPTKPIERAIVVGGGNMGAAIAYALASAGLAVTLVERDDSAQKRARDNTGRLVLQGAKRGVLSKPSADAITERIHFTIGYGSLPAADIAIEAVFEDIGVKHQVFAELQGALPDTTILATNTSYLDVDAIAGRIARPERFLGIHFFSPAHIMKLVEVVRGAATSPETLGSAFALSKMLNKVPVLAGVSDGFIGNRILTRYRHAADILLIEGGLPSQVDAAMRGFGMAMGPYEAQDMSGLDIAHANRKRNASRSRADKRFGAISDCLVEDFVRLGKKSGGGWYDYDDGGKPVRSPQVEDCILMTSRGFGVSRRHFEDAEIVDRLVLAMIAEACDILDEGIAASPQDVDLVMIHGYGFPRCRGGLMHYADSMRPAEIATWIRQYAHQDPVSWSVPPLLDRLAHAGQTFSGLNPQSVGKAN
jgi:3-hydroxyacyl-CoA dehydrogenase